MSAVAKFQMGASSETTWNSGSTPSRFFEIVEEKVQPVFERINVPGIRAGSRAQRSDRSVPYFSKAEGSFKIPVLSKGFGFWLAHMLGTVSTSGPSSLLYTHRATVGDLLGKGFTWQVNRPFHPSDTSQPFTLTGGKVNKWTLEAKAGEALTVEIEGIWAGQDTSTELASASYPSGTVEGLTFIGASLQFSSSSFDVGTSFKVTCDNKLDRGSYLRSSPAIKEPVQTDLVEVSWEVECDFADLTQRNRFASEVAADNYARIVAVFQGQIANASDSYPTLTVYLPAARFDGEDPNISGPDPLSHKLSGMGHLDSNLEGPVIVEYATADSTP